MLRVLSFVATIELLFIVEVDAVVVAVADEEVEDAVLTKPFASSSNIRVVELIFVQRASKAGVVLIKCVSFFLFP